MGKRATASAIAQIKTVINGQNAIIATMNMVKMRSPSFTSSVIREDSMGVIYYKEDNKTLGRMIF
jgi:hypothetical protein